jgi:hypothetical protein
MPTGSNPWRMAELTPAAAARKAARLASERAALRAERRSLRLYDPRDAVSRMGLRGEIRSLDRQIKALRAVQDERREPVSRPGRMKSLPTRRAG